MRAAATFILCLVYNSYIIFIVLKQKIVILGRFATFFPAYIGISFVMVRLFVNKLTSKLTKWTYQDTRNEVNESKTRKQNSG